MEPTHIMKPSRRPQRPNFSSGPCAKRPGWSPEILSEAVIGRSHRSLVGIDRIKSLLDGTRLVLDLPSDYQLAIVPGSDTGAFEMALWSLLGSRGVDVLAWESFGYGWELDVVNQLKIKDLRVLKSGYGALPDLTLAQSDRDVVFCWNGTTSGVCVPNGDWISDEREGLTICDATSAVFLMELPWKRLDVTSYSWQKALGGEAAHGMLILSPRAVERLESHVPSWPLPKIFRLTKDGLLNKGIFDGLTINTPSMLCVEDALDALAWVKEIGGVSTMIARTKSNLAEVEEWVKETVWVEFLANEATFRSSTSICLKITDPWFVELEELGQRALIKGMVALLEDEGVAYDIGAHRDAPPGLRIWGGATVSREDIAALLPWLDWSYGKIRATFIESA